MESELRAIALHKRPKRERRIGEEQEEKVESKYCQEGRRKETIKVGLVREPDRRQSQSMNMNDQGTAFLEHLKHDRHSTD